MWPWKRREKRASFTDGIVAGLLAQAEGAHASASSTGILEACAGLYASAFAAARIEDAPGWLRHSLGPALLSHVARNLIRTGECVFEIEVSDDGGGVRLTPAGSWDVTGGPNPIDWTYRLDTFGPSGNETRIRPSAGVLHFRYAFDPARPWQGIGPLQFASSTASLGGRLESLLGAEAGGPSAYLLPIPADGGGADEGETDPIDGLKKDFLKARGRVTFVETTSDAWGQGGHAAPRRDWEQRRVGAAWPDELRSTRSDVGDAIANACNVPLSLLTSSAEGTAQREALRRFAHVGLEPLGRIVAAELAFKLEAPDLILTFRRLFAGDQAGRVRALKGLVESGVDLSTALELAGLSDKR